MLETAVFCMALNVYFEARGEPLLGQIAVAQVTMNRVHDKRFPKTVCEVVLEHKQFSWTNTRIQTVHDAKGNVIGKQLRPGLAPTDHKAWQQAVRVAKEAIKGDYKGYSTALYYHKHTIKPYWSVGEKQAVATVGNHLFFDKTKSLLSYNVKSKQKKREA